MRKKIRKEIRREMFDLIKSIVQDYYMSFLIKSMSDASDGTEELIVHTEEFEKEVNIITVAYYKAFFGIIPTTHHNTYYPPGHEKRISNIMFLKHEYSNIPSDTNLYQKITEGYNNIVDYCVNYSSFEKYVYHDLLPTFFNPNLILSKYRAYSFKSYGIVDSDEVNDLISTFIYEMYRHDKQKLFDDVELKKVFYTKRVKMCYDYLKGIGINEECFSELKKEIPDFLEDSSIIKKPKRIKI